MVDVSKKIVPALGQLEFSMSRRGYDREGVKAALPEIEAKLRELEDSAVRGRVRLRVAGEMSDGNGAGETDMIAVAKADDRALVKSRLSAQGPKAEAKAMTHFERVESALTHGDRLMIRNPQEATEQPTRGERGQVNNSTRFEPGRGP